MFDEEKQEYAYLKSDPWLRYVFVDDSTPNCSSRIMKKQLIADRTYDRWIGSTNEDGKAVGHLFGISRYSFVILAADAWFNKNHLLNHFSNVYFQIILLSLVQRASIISYAGEATRIVNLIKTHDELSTKQIKDINALSQSFLVFKNQIYFREITAQEQGIEIYYKVHQHMNIQNEIEALEAEIEDLMNFVNSNSETIRSKEAQNLTRLATWFLPAGVIVGLMGISAVDPTNMHWGGRIVWNAWYWVITAVVLSLLFGSVIFFYFMNVKNRLKSKK